MYLKAINNLDPFQNLLCMWITMDHLVYLRLGMYLRAMNNLGRFQNPLCM